MLRVRIRNNFKTTSATTISSKSITLPLGVQFTPTDYEDQREEILEQERQKSINKPIDGETIKYTKNGGVTINVRFYNENTNTFQNTYESIGFTSEDYLKQNFKRSFYRLYFYDAIDDNNNNLLFTEDIGTLDDYDGGISETPTLNLDRLFWLRNDNYFITNSTDRDIYMDARFFNAKTGKQHKLIPIPTTVGTPTYNSQVTNNPTWIKCKFTLLNPNTNNGYYNFSTVNNTITLTEDIRI
jgi:hypothetical protein